MAIFAKSSYFSFQDLSALDEFSVFRYIYFPLILFGQLRLSGSQSEPSSLLRISAKNREEHSSSSLLSSFVLDNVCPQLQNIHPRLSSFDCIFVCSFFFELLYFLHGNLRETCRHFLENKSKNVIVFSVGMSTLLYHPAFAVIPVLRGNSDANNQSNLQNFSAYIRNLIICLKVGGENVLAVSMCSAPLTTSSS